MTLQDDIIATLGVKPEISPAEAEAPPPIIMQS